jgi:hypothetical protein
MRTKSGTFSALPPDWAGSFSRLRPEHHIGSFRRQIKVLCVGKTGDPGKRKRRPAFVDLLFFHGAGYF